MRQPRELKYFIRGQSLRQKDLHGGVVIKHAFVYAWADTGTYELILVAEKNKRTLTKPVLSFLVVLSSL